MVSTISTKQIWKVAYPIIIGSIAQNILNVTDTAFLGRLGEVALGGGVIGGLFYLVLIMLGWGMAIGGQIIIARRYGEGAHHSIGRVVEHLFYFLILFATFLAITVSFFAHDLLGWFVKSTLILDASNTFIDFRIWGLFFAFTNFTFRAFYIGIARTKVITVTTVIMVLVNIVLDYALIFGHWGLPEMGIGGAALASVIAEATCSISFLIYTYYHFNYEHYNLFKYTGISKKLSLRLLDISVPLMFQHFFSFFIWFIFFLFIEKMGETPLAVSNIVRSVYIVLMIPIWGFGSATNTFVSQLIGQERSKEVLPLVYKVISISMSLVFMLALICLSIPRLVLMIYTNDPILIEQSLPLMYVIAFAAIGMAGAFVVFNGVSGTGNTKVSFAIEAGTLVVYIAWAYFTAIVLHKPLIWVWCSEVLYGIFITTISLWYLKSNRWLGKVV